MKILGKTAEGYLLSATEGEIATAMGAPSGTYGAEWKALSAPLRRYGENGLMIGSTILLQTAHAHVGEMIRRDAEFRKMAEFLRAYAGLLEMGFSMIMVAPKDDPEEPEELFT
jgi:hypothetical protein